MVTCVDIHAETSSKEAKQTILAFEGVMQLQAGSHQLGDIFAVIAGDLFKRGFDYAFRYIEENERRYNSILVENDRDHWFKPMPPEPEKTGLATEASNNPA